jgi:hypothetical protein
MHRKVFKKKKKKILNVCSKNILKQDLVELKHVITKAQNGFFSVNLVLFVSKTFT